MGLALASRGVAKNATLNSIATYRVTRRVAIVEMQQTNGAVRDDANSGSAPAGVQ